MAQASDDLVVRFCEPTDFDAVMALVRTCYGKAAEAPQWWRWRHFGDSHKEGFVYLATRGEQLCGIRPVEIFPYHWRGAVLRGAYFSAVMVHPKHRRQGVFKRLVGEAVQESWRRGASFITTMPNRHSYRGYAALGWRDLGDRTLLIYSPWLHPRGQRHLVSSWHCRVVGELGSDLMHWTSDTCRAAPYAVLARTPEWLKWRFAKDPSHGYIRIEARDDKQAPGGYAIIKRQERYGLAIGYVVDLWSPLAEARLALLRRACDLLLAQKVRLVMMVASLSDVIRECQQIGFLLVPPWCAPKCFHTMWLTNPAGPLHGVSTDLEYIGSWYQTLADWDGV